MLTDFFRIIKKINRLLNFDKLGELWLFFFVFVLLLIRFLPLFQGGILAGWDTLPHFIHLKDMVSVYFEGGSYTGYALERFGGAPIFYFYPPLFFIVLALFWKLFLGLLSLEIIFRAALFVILLLFIFSFWYFVKTFADRRAGRFAILFSLIFIFFPTAYSPLGMGAGAVFIMGLFNSVLALSFLLLAFSFLENLRKSIAGQDNNSLTWFFAFVFSSSAIVLTHSLTTIAAIFLGIIYLALHITDFKFLKTAFLSAILIAIITAPFIFSFIIDLEHSTAGSLGLFLDLDPLRSIFPFDLSKLGSFSSIFSFEFWAVFLMLLTAVGAIKMFKSGFYFIPVAFLATTLFLVRNYFWTLLPSLPIHYYRFHPLILVFALAIASFAIARLTDLKLNKKWLVFIVGFLACLFIFQSYMLFTLNFGSYYTPYHWNIDDYPLAKEGKALVEKLKNIDVQRVIVEPDRLRYYSSFGSPHYFSSLIPKLNQQSSLMGLYAESSPLSPFIFAATEQLTGRLFGWGDTRLSRYASSLWLQDPSIHIRRLAHMGLSHFVAFNEEVKQRLEKTNMVRAVDSESGFVVYEVLNYNPLVFYPEYKPALYINYDNKMLFRDLAFAVFESVDSFDFPIAEWPNAIDNLDQGIVENFSFLVISGQELSQENFNKLKLLEKPLIILNGGKDDFFGENVFVIQEFRRLPWQNVFHFDYPYIKKPRGWLEFQKIIEELKERLERSNQPEIIAFDNQQIKIKGDGPIIINAGYSPLWKLDNFKSTPVFRVTPGMMMVFGSGEIELFYVNKITNKQLAVFYTALLMIFAFIVFIHKRTKIKLF